MKIHLQNLIYPGMDIMSEVIDIKNGGDSAAMIDYKIKYRG